jgi:hypothetical protein
MAGSVRRALALLVVALLGVVIVGTTPTGAAPRESENGSVYRLYSAYLLREPDAPGLAYWSEQYLSCSQSLASISEFFASSPEFTARYGSLSNRQFVELIYTNVLGRAGEPAGVDYWAGRLDAGVARGQIMIGFSESSEYVAATGTTNPAGTGCAAPPTTTTPPVTTTPPTTTPPSVYYANCAEVRAAGKAPLYSGQPGYRPGLDGDGDGVACES